MPSEHAEIGTPADWLRRARSNLARARQAKTDEIVWEDLCFDAQQAVEKSLKALLLFRHIEFPFVHNIAVLLTLLDNAGLALPETVRMAADLTDYAVMTRYPGTAEKVDEEDHKEALKTAATVYSWVADQVATLATERPNRGPT